MLNQKTNHKLKLIASAGALWIGMNLAGCRVDKTEDGKMPEVKVEQGKLPKYDVKTGKVEVTKEKVEVEVPKVKVTMPPAQGTEPAPPPPNQ